jgi:hypothetical protein
LELLAGNCEGTRVLNRRQLTQLLLAAPFAARAQSPGEAVLKSTNGVPVPGPNINIGALPAVAAPNPTAYSALKVPRMAAGTAFNDPVTGTRTVKVTSNGTPGTSQFWTIYSTLGLQISQPWGADLNQYTITFIDSSGGLYLCDYRLGGTISNYRTVPGAGESRVAFSRLAGQAQVMYIQSGSRLSKYNTAKNSLANGGMFPIAWPTDPGTNCWLQLNQAETWATGQLEQKDNAVTALNTTTGKVITQRLPGIDELYSGYNNVALINCDAGGSGPKAGYVWNLDTNTLTSIGLPYGDMPYISHVPSMRGFWIATDTNTGKGGMPLFKINEDGSHSQVSTFQGYYGQWHNCGHWKQSAGLEQYMLYSMWNPPSDGWTPSLQYALVFVRCDNGSTAVLGHHYSVLPPATTHPYWSAPRATQSTDGRLVIFTSNMLNGPRNDVFLMEVPVS